MIITKTFHTSKPESLIDDLPYRYFNPHDKRKKNLIENYSAKSTYDEVWQEVKTLDFS